MQAQSVGAWFVENSSWLGWPVMVLAGGAVAWIQLYESARVHWTVRQHVGCLFFCWVKSAFIGALMYQVYLGALGFNPGLPACLLATGLFSAFANDALKKLYDLATRTIFGKAGLPGVITPPQLPPPANGSDDDAGK